LYTLIEHAPADRSWSSPTRGFKYIGKKTSSPKKLFRATSILYFALVISISLENDSVFASTLEQAVFVLTETRTHFWVALYAPLAEEYQRQGAK
jgi:hypothetical protein